MIRFARPRIRPTSWFRRFSGLPSLVPRALAAARAALVRDEIILRSACAITARSPDDHLIGFRQVGCNELHAGLLKAEEEVRVTAQAIELRDHQSGVVEPAQGHCFLQLRPVVLLAALDLDVLGNKLPPSPI